MLLPVLRLSFSPSDCSSDFYSWSPASFLFLLSYPKLSKQCGWWTYKYLLNFLGFVSLVVTWTFTTLLRNWIAEASEKCLWNKSALCNMCGCLRDAFEACPFVNWRKNVKGSPFVPHLCSWWLNLLLCSSRIFSSAHTVSNVEAVLFGTGRQQLRKCLLARETRKSATIFPLSILKTNLYLQK